MSFVPHRFVQIANPHRAVDCGDFLSRHDHVNAVAGIGNPTRFVQTLKEMGLNPILHAHPDHHRYDGSELKFDNGWPVVCTEKDATKLRELADLPDDIYYLEVDTDVCSLGGEPGIDRLQSVLAAHGIRAKAAQDAPASATQDIPARAAHEKQIRAAHGTRKR